MSLIATNNQSFASDFVSCFLDSRTVHTSSPTFTASPSSAPLNGLESPDILRSSKSTTPSSALDTTTRSQPTGSARWPSGRHSARPGSSPRQCSSRERSPRHVAHERNRKLNTPIGFSTRPSERRPTIRLGRAAPRVSTRKPVVRQPVGRRPRQKIMWRRRYRLSFRHDSGGCGIFDSSPRHGRNPDPLSSVSRALRGSNRLDSRCSIGPVRAARQAVLHLRGCIPKCHIENG